MARSPLSPGDKRRVFRAARDDAERKLAPEDVEVFLEWYRELLDTAVPPPTIRGALEAYQAAQEEQRLREERPEGWRA